MVQTVKRPVIKVPPSTFPNNRATIFLWGQTRAPALSSPKGGLFHFVAQVFRNVPSSLAKWDTMEQNGTHFFRSLRAPHPQRGQLRLIL